jgi:hypothetical protein
MRTHPICPACGNPADGCDADGQMCRCCRDRGLSCHYCLHLFGAKPEGGAASESSDDREPDNHPSRGGPESYGQPMSGWDSNDPPWFFNDYCGWNGM